MSCEYWDEEIKTCRRSEVPRIAIPSDVNLDEAIRNNEFKVIRFADVPEPKIENRWRDPIKEPPTILGDVIVTRKILGENEAICAEYAGRESGKARFKRRFGNFIDDVVAWMPLPEPWKGDEE